MDISLRDPFDFGHTLRFLHAFSPMAGEQRVSSDTLVKSWIVRETPVTVTMRQEGTRLRLALDKRLDAETDAALAERVASFVSADEDLSGFYDLASRDEQFAPVAKKLRGFHHPRFATPFEAACWSVINQRIQLGQARKMKSAIVTKWGKKGVEAFPEAATLARATEKELARVIGNERKARAVFAVSQAFAKVDEKWLQTAPIAEVDAWLRRIWGVGDFASGFILYRGLGRARSLPWSDMFVRAARATYPGADRPTLERKGDAYGRWKGHWALYLWAVTLT
jgi:DNA-3-methyladenine glycosylase II